MTVQVPGRRLAPEQIEGLRQLVQQHPEWSRWRLSQEVCRRWEWRSPKGQLQDLAARALLLKLQARGLLVLPPAQHVAFNRMRHRQVRAVDHTGEPIQGDLAALRPLAVRELSQWPADQELFEDVPGPKRRKQLSERVLGLL